MLIHHDRIETRIVGLNEDEEVAVGLDVVAERRLDRQDQVLPVDCVLVFVQAISNREADIVDGSFDVLGYTS